MGVEKPVETSELARFDKLTELLSQVSRFGLYS